MIHHISIGVKEPERVARVLAELWEGYAMPFPVAEGGWLLSTEALDTVLPRGSAGT